MKTKLSFFFCAVALFSSVHSRQKIAISNGGYNNVVIGIADDVVPASAQGFIDQLKTLITDASQRLHSATLEKVFFNSITISAPSSWTLDVVNDQSSNVAYETADFRIVNSDVQSRGDAPWTSHSEYCGSQGEYISLTKSFIEGGQSFVDSFGDRGKAIIHEWAHFRWGVFEEYGFPGDKRFPYFYFPPGETKQIATYSATQNLSGIYRKLDGATCSDVDGVFPDDCRFFPDDSNTASISMMSYHFSPLATTFDDSSYHKKEVPSKHNQLCDHNSIWSVMMRNSIDFPSGGSTTQFMPPTFRVVKRDTRPAVMILFDTGRGPSTNPYADIAEIKTHLTGTAPDFVGRHVGLVTYSGGLATTTTTIKRPLQMLETADELITIIEAVQQTSETASTMAYPLDMAIRELATYGSPAGGIVYIVGYAGSGDNPSRYRESAVISLAVEKKVKLICQESLLVNLNGNLGRMSDLTGGKRFAISQNLTSSALTENYNTVKEEFNSVTKITKTVLSTSSTASTTSPSTIKFKVSDSGSGKLQVMLTGVRTGPNLSACTVKLTSPTSEQTTGILTTNWNGGATTSNRLITVETTVKPGEWTLDTSCTPTTPVLFWIDVLGPKEDISISALAWSSSHPATTASGSVRLYAKISQGQNWVAGARVLAYIRPLVELPVPSTNLVTVELTDNGYGDPDVAVDGVYSGLIVPSVAPANGEYRVSILVQPSSSRAMKSAIGESSIRADQNAICCGSSSPSNSISLPQSFQQFSQDVLTLSVTGLTTTYKPPRITVSSITASELTEPNQFRVVMKWKAPVGSATNAATPVDGYDVYISDNVQAINTSVTTLTSCSPASPGTEQTCEFTTSFEGLTLFARVNARVGTQKGDLSPIVWSAPLAENPTTEASTTQAATETTTATSEPTTTASSSATEGSTTQATTETTTATPETTTTESTTTSSSSITTVATTTASTDPSTGTTTTESTTAPSTSEATISTTAQSTSTNPTTTSESTSTSISTAASTTTSPTSTETTKTPDSSSSSSTTATTITAASTTQSTTNSTSTTTSSTSESTGTTPTTSTSSTTVASTSTTSPTTMTTGTTTTATSPGTSTNTTPSTITSSSTVSTTSSSTSTNPSTSTSTSTTPSTVPSTSTTPESSTSTVTTTEPATTTQSTPPTVITDSTTTIATTTTTADPSSSSTMSSSPPVTEPPCSPEDATCQDWFLPVVIAVPIGGVLLILAASGLTYYCVKKKYSGKRFDDEVPLTPNRPNPPPPKAKSEPPVAQAPSKPAPQVSYSSESQMTRRPVNSGYAARPLSIGETVEDDDLAYTSL